MNSTANTAASPAKFMFDLDFAGGAEKAPAKATILLSEHTALLGDAEARGYRNGFAAAEAQARAAVELRTAAALDQIAGALDRLVAGLKGVEARLETEAVDVAVAVGRKLSAELIAREPFAEVAALASSCFRHLAGTPHVVVRVHEATYEVAREKLEGIAHMRGFDGRLVVLADPELAPGDCRIEWADGGITRDRASIDAAIGTEVGRYVSARMTAASA